MLFVRSTLLQRSCLLFCISEMNTVCNLARDSPSVAKISDFNFTASRYTAFSRGYVCVLNNLIYIKHFITCVGPFAGGCKTK